MLGAIAGDIIGSPYERYPIKTKEFPLFSEGSCFTDDTVLTMAVADAILRDRSYARSLEDYYYFYPLVPYGARFHDWAASTDHVPYNSWGNGSAMRVSPVVYVTESVEAVLEEAKGTAEVTHNHPEGIKGAQATALAAWLARNGSTKQGIRDEIQARFQYDLSRKLDDIRPGYSCDLSCQHTVPEAIICFLEADGFEDTVRNAVSLGGDADTMACIAGGIAEHHYGVRDTVRARTLDYLDERLTGVLTRFLKRYGRDLK